MMQHSTAPAFKLLPLKLLPVVGFAAMLLASTAATSVLARDAAFMAPGTSGGSSNVGGDEALRVEPKNEIDTGETTLGVARRTNLFFVNQTNMPIQIE